MELKHLHPLKLKPYEKNPRINHHAVNAVSRSIQEFGFNCPIVVDSNMRICAGHTRWKAANKLKLESVPVIVVDSLIAEKFIAFNIADNQTASLATWNDDKLIELIRELEETEFELKKLGFSKDELNDLMQRDDNDQEVEVCQSGDASTRPGDVYELDNHRLLCADSADNNSMQSVLDGKSIDLILGGPPIFGQLDLSKHTNYNDYLDEMRHIMEIQLSVIKPGGVAVWHVGNCTTSKHDNISYISTLLDNVGWNYLDTIIWSKTTANYGVGRNCHIKKTGHYYPAFQWEALLVYQKDGKLSCMTPQAREYMNIHHTNLWEIACERNSMKRFSHPAACPVEISYRAMLAYGRPGEFILDTFAGSGSSLIAAEKYQMNAILIEKNPAFCDAIINRWEIYTGKKAKLL